MARDYRRDRDDDYDDDRPARRRSRDDFEDDYDDRSRGGPPRKGVSVVGVIALILGLVGLVMSLIPCIGFVGVPVAAIGLLLGIIGLFTSGKTTGRGMPIAGTCVSLAGLLIGGTWLAFIAVSMKRGEERLEVARQELEKAGKAAEAQARLNEERRRKEEAELREGKAVVVTAAQLYADYDTNPLSADSKYKNKVLEITGEFRRLEPERFRKLTVELKSDDPLGVGVIRCEFLADAAAQLEKLRAEQIVTIRGRCTGLEAKKDSVKLENCLLVSK